MQSGKPVKRIRLVSHFQLLKGFVLLIKIGAIFRSNPAVSTVSTQPVVMCSYFFHQLRLKLFAIVEFHRFVSRDKVFMKR